SCFEPRWVPAATSERPASPRAFPSTGGGPGESRNTRRPSRKREDSSASRGDRSFCRRHSSQMVERGRRSLGVQRPGNSGGRLGSLPPGGVCGGQRQPERSAIDLLYCPRAVAPSQLTVDCDSAPSHSAHRFPCHSVHRARPGQIPRIELARFTRFVSRCAACGRRERLGVRCRATRIFNKSAVLGVGWRDSARSANRKLARTVDQRRPFGKYWADEFTVKSANPRRGHSQIWSIREKRLNCW